jgi:beta-lactamase superfamily II metal-dependent hydrolase
MLDVGQGESLVLRFPNGKVGVIDGGVAYGSGSRGRSTVEPYLRSLGVKRIDFIVASHADADHIGGLIHLVENFKVGAFYQGRDTADTDLYLALMTSLQAKRVPVRVLEAGQSIRGLGGTTIEALNPGAGFDDNNASLALLLDHGDVEMMLTGDIEAPAEREIVESGLARDVEVLKVAHHGSRSSTADEFLQAFRPEIALISAGRSNRYGHPSPVVVDRLKRRGIAIARTDQLGSIRLRTNGRTIRLDHFGGDRPAD